MDPSQIQSGKALLVISSFINSFIHSTNNAVCLHLLALCLEELGNRSEVVNKIDTVPVLTELLASE